MYFPSFSAIFSAAGALRPHALTCREHGPRKHLCDPAHTIQFDELQSQRKRLQVNQDMAMHAEI